MIATLLLSLQMMAGLFLLLLGGVGFIQDKRFFSSAPAQTQAVVPASKPERFPGQHAVGWVMILLAFALMGGAIVLGAWDGIQNGFGFWQFALQDVGQAIENQVLVVLHHASHEHGGSNGCCFLFDLYPRASMIPCESSV